EPFTLRYSVGGLTKLNHVYISVSGSLCVMIDLSPLPCYLPPYPCLILHRTFFTTIISLTSWIIAESMTILPIVTYTNIPFDDDALFYKRQSFRQKDFILI